MKTSAGMLDRMVIKAGGALFGLLHCWCNAGKTGLDNGKFGRVCEFNSGF